MTSQQVRAFWVEAPGRGVIRDEPMPVAGPGDAIVRTLFSGISRGTESLVFSGRVPETERQRMRAPFQAGEFPGPVKYGYCNVGEVESGPDDVMGRRVFSLFPHQTRFVVPATALRVLPESVPAARAVLAANMETALNGVWDSGVQHGDRVVVIGAGAVGCLVAWLIGRVPGTDVCLIDINRSRAAIATTLGVRFAEPPDAPVECDVVIHASGSPAGLALGLDCAGFEARIVEMSWYGSREVALPLGEAFHAKRLSICSSQVGQIATSHRSRWDHRRRMELAISLLEEPALEILITGESRFDDLPVVMKELAEGTLDAICQRIRY